MAKQKFVTLVATIKVRVPVDEVGAPAMDASDLEDLLADPIDDLAQDLADSADDLDAYVDSDPVRIQVKQR